MTEETNETPGGDNAPDLTETPPPATPLSGKKTKAFWAGVGIGSAAIVAAVMYARRPKKTRR
ncbi:MAG TPA: hypothetical protein VGE65_06495 [Sphingobium sp.]